MLYGKKVLSPDRPEEKENQSLYYPTRTDVRDGRKSFITILLEEIQAGKVKTAYSAQNMSVPTTYQDIQTHMGATYEDPAYPD